MTEPFSQWVIEDHFADGRPDWSKAGARFVADVEPFELMKLRLLNGSHSTLAYLGYLAGHETVADAMSDAPFAALLKAMMAEEIAPTLPPLFGFDLAAYQAELLQRFRNPALRHRTWQIAMDGSQKVPQRLLGTIRARLAAGEPFGRLALGLAGWIRYASGRDEGAARSTCAIRSPRSCARWPRRRATTRPASPTRSSRSTRCSARTCRPTPLPQGGRGGARPADRGRRARRRRRAGLTRQTERIRPPSTRMFWPVM